MTEPQRDVGKQAGDEAKQPHIVLECRPKVPFAAIYERLPFPHLAPIQEVAFDLGATAVNGAFSLVGAVIRGYAGGQMLFEQRWPERFMRRKTGLDDLNIPAGEGIALRSMHFQVHGYERLTHIELTVVGKSLDTQETRQAMLRVPVEFPQLQTHLHFPLSGTWWVIQAGDWSDMHKSEVLSQPYAIDLVKLGENNQFFQGDGARLADHESWNQPVYAAADGKVARICYDMPDMRPGTTPDPLIYIDDPRRLLGNAVAIDHGNGEFSYCAHLRQGSVAVNYGQAVRRGDLLGRVGNSGQSPGPHLHFHLMNGPNPYIDQGLPLKLSHFYAGGEFFEKPIAVPTRMLITGVPRDKAQGTEEQS